MFDNAKDLFKSLATEELSKDEILNMLTEDMCAELIVKHNAAYLEENGKKYDYRYDGEVIGTFDAPKMERDRMEILLYNAITYIEDQGISGWEWMPELGISDEEYNAIFDAAENKEAMFTHWLSFTSMIGDSEQDVDFGIVGDIDKPSLERSAEEIYTVLSALCSEDELLRAIETIDCLEIVSERNGEYFDRDEADEEVVAKIVELTKAHLIKPSLEGQINDADELKKHAVGNDKVTSKDDLTL